MTSTDRCLVALALTLAAWSPPARAAAQAPVDPAPVRFAEAVRLAVERNPSLQQAAADILRAQALLRQASSAVLPSVAAGAVTTTLNEGREFGGNVATPRNQLVASLSVSELLFAPVQWAFRAQSADNVRVSEALGAETRRQVASAAAQAYLAVIARSRVFDAQVRARDTARAHYELARRQRELGAGSRLNELRAQQSLSSDEALVEQAALDVARAQEALGVLVALDGPATTVDEPALEVPVDLSAAVARLFQARSDVQAATAREQAATRVLHDSWKEWLPSVTGLFQPQYVNPETLFQPAWSWRAQVQASVPIFDGGARSGRRLERQAVLDQARVGLTAAERQARSDVRTAQDGVRHASSALTSARAAAELARQVVDIVNVSFQAGASTNIEVIDAQRAARDADTAAAVAEDQLRQARLALLVALGLFP
jgi:outer membrane protein